MVCSDIEYDFLRPSVSVVSVVTEGLHLRLYYECRIRLFLSQHS